MSRWAKQITRVGRDSLHLAEAIFKDSTTKRTVSFKPVLLDQARQSNSVANSLLRVDQQIGLVRYYGIVGYFRQQWQVRFSSSLPSSTNNTATTTTTAASEGASLFSTTSETSSTIDPPPRARIAFMITGSMRKELKEELGYDLDNQVKKMTPLQASLILHYRITADEMEEKLPSVEAQYEKRQEEDALKQSQEAAAQREQFQAAKLSEMKKEQELRKAQQEPTAESPVARDTVDTDTSTKVPNPLSLNSVTSKAERFQSSNLLLSPSSDGAPGFGESWFEVIEINPKGESSRVGLYLDEEEAILGLETRQEIAEHQGTDKTFELKPVEKSDIFSSQK